jgi:hypothetical protein
VQTRRCQPRARARPCRPWRACSLRKARHASQVRASESARWHAHSAKLRPSGGAALTAAHPQIPILIGPAAGAYLVFPIIILIVLLPASAAIHEWLAL